MQYIHIKNLEKFNPGYKDRELRWAKIHFNMVQGNPDCDLIDNEIDWARLIKFILLEMQAKQPIPMDAKYLAKKGFDLKKRPIQLTIQMLHNFLEVVTQENKTCSLEKSRVEYSRVDKKGFVKPSLEELAQYIQERKYQVSAASFLDWYNSNGWKVGKNPMKDWKATVNQWHHRDMQKEKPNDKKKRWI